MVTALSEGIATVTKGLVSTIIPVFNRAAMLREAVASVLAQTWRPIEIVIVDDGSSDDTRAVAHELAASHPDIVRVLSQPNAGPGAARQTGLEAASGEFIQFLDSDDLLLPEKFALQVAGLRSDADSGISYGKTYTREHGVRKPAAAQRSAERHRTIFPALLTGRLWETSTPLYRRTALDRIGPWPRKRQMEDWEFDARAGAAGIKLHYCDAFVTEYRIHAGPRLAHAWMADPSAMGDRISAHAGVLYCARQAGVADKSREMQRYARTLFCIARDAGAAGYTAEAEIMLELVCGIVKARATPAIDVLVYALLSRILGWRALGWVTRSMQSVLQSVRV